MPAPPPRAPLTAAQLQQIITDTRLYCSRSCSPGQGSPPRVAHELLEEAVLDMAGQMADAQQRALETLASAINKVAPDLAIELRARIRNEFAALDTFVDFLRSHAT